MCGGYYWHATYWTIEVTHNSAQHHSKEQKSVMLLGIGNNERGDEKVEMSGE
jgi:hypothetical protein